MGCLKIDIQPVFGNLFVKLDKVGGINALFRILKSRACEMLKAAIVTVSGIFFTAKVVDTDFNSSVSCVSSVPSISVGIVCDVGLDTESYLQVFEGNLITIDGCFLKVLKG